MKRFCSIFKQSKPVIGMIHVGGLPGSPKYKGCVNKLVEDACIEAEIYKSSCVRCIDWHAEVIAPERGVEALFSFLDSVMIENMHDIPYIRSSDFQPEVVSVMTRVANEVRKVLPLKIPCGIQVLAGGNKEAISIAKACNLQFVRVEGFVFSHIGDEGFLDASAGPLLRYRKAIDAESVFVFTDIKKKHSSHQITNDITIEETAKAAEFFLSDGVILTGTSTGSPADLDELKKLKRSINIPVLIGSGVTSSNIQSYMEADAFIIGSHFKEDGRWEKSLSKEKVNSFMEKISNLR